MLKAVINGQFDFLNFFKYPVDMPVTGEYDIPIVKGIKLKHPEKYKLIAFDESHLIPPEERKKYIVHFFIYDYKFERVWTYIYKYTEYLQQFAAVIQPDFSLYTDMPRAMQIWNAYRANFMAWWWQNEGIKVIPIGYWTDEQSFDFCFGSMPENSCICISSKGSYSEDKRDTKLNTLTPINSGFKKGLEALIDRLHPSQLLWIGIKPLWMGQLEEQGIQIITIPERKLYNERLSKKRKQVK